ncbi:uncharacterized protein LOC141850273 [Brevipalpus obovatus]|uniref:uncharacterized protein LOC141850273 n=1 Tax=Brevipalpus obovatus TaxID=246614 RepID=UPI003D9F4132
MDALLQPLIIDRVFDFLGIFDIHECQYVCKIWRESALRRLKKNPSIDKFHAIATCRYWYPENDETDLDDNPEDASNAYKQRIEIIIENREMNKVELNEHANLLHDWAYYWYIERSLKNGLMPKFEVDNALQGYLTNDAKCIPRFSFILYSEKFQNIVEKITLRYPALLIRQGGTRYIDDTLEKELDVKIETQFSHKDSHPGLYLGSTMLYSYFNSFHVDRYIPGVKIVVTDWSDPQSPRPDASDAEFPIKSVVYLANTTAFNYDRIDNIRKFLKSFEPNVSGGIIEYGWKEHHIPIFLSHPKRQKYKSASKITVAFTGTEVRSAIHRIKNWSNVEEKLNEFKQGLDFPTDNGRMIGFLFDLNLTFPQELHKKIRSLFPNIQLIRLIMRKLLEPTEGQSSDMIFHLVRF